MIMIRNIRNWKVHMWITLRKWFK